MFPCLQTETAIDVLIPVSAARRTKSARKNVFFADTEEKYPTPDEESETECTKRKAN